MLVNVCFDDDMHDVDVIDLPAEILKRVEEFQQQFFGWLFDKSNKHKYWICEEGIPQYCAYRSDAFVEWINEYQSKGITEKAAVVKICTNNIDNSIPRIYF